MTDDQHPAPQDRRGHPTDAEAARHVAETCDGLRRVARGPRLRTVYYLLGLVRIEAEKLIDEPRG